MTLEEQWQEDVKRFGELAYLMWEIEKYYGNSYYGFYQAASNDEVLYAEKCCIFEEIARRKQSAVLPFDLVAARAGDDIECKTGSNWIDCKFHAPFSKKSFIVIDEMGDSLIICIDDLRMKHPRRVGVDYSQFEDKP